jgi:hypothetical protein
VNDVRLPDDRPLSRARFEATARELRRLPRRHRSRWGMTLALAGALVLLSAVAAVGYGLISPQERFGSLGCYDQPSLDGSVAIVSTSDRDPTEVCRRLWINGEVGGAEDPVPAELTACVLPGDGAVGVFPGDGDVCGELGLQALRDVEVTPGDVSIPRLEDMLRDRLPDPDDECLEIAEARHRVEQVLAELHASDWTVVSRGSDTDGSVTCADIDTLDVPGRIILLGSVPAPQSPERRVARRLADIAADGCIGDRRAARTTAEQALRDLGFTDWIVEVDDDVWDANEDVAGMEGLERCALFQVSEQTVTVQSVIREPESGWRRFVPGM